MLLTDLVAASAAVAATRSRKTKIAVLAEALRRMDDDEVAVGARYLAGLTTQPRLDVGWRMIGDLEVPAADEPSLAIRDVDAELERLAAVSGPGSRVARIEVLGSLLSRATADEQHFLRGLILGELRQGALAGIAAQAIAAAWELPESTVRRALLLNADLGAVAVAASSGGQAALEGFSLELFRPVAPMLASTSGGLADAMEGMDDAVAEHKLDGARIQVHRRGADVAVYTRNLRDITARVPDVVTPVAALGVRSVVLDGEVLVLRPDGRPQAFQDTMSRFGSDDADALAAAAGLRPFFFDVMHLDGQDLLDEPLAARQRALDAVVPEAGRIPRRAVSDVADARTMLDEALAAGHEGIMVKSLGSTYEAGRRGAAWRKVKPVHTLDLLVIAAEWGSGRRQGWLSNLHLAALDDNGAPVMLGKTFKGMTDEMLQWQTERLLELEERREGHTVFVRPELVAEVAFDGVQSSSRYPGGVTLRFARIKRYREDKPPSEADTLATVRALKR